jgi:hypothetical protein
MGVGYNSRVVTNGLVLSLDAANPKCFPTTTPIQEHGYADWYCFVTGTATYSIVSSGVSIIERDTNGTLTTMVASSSGPTRGTFTVTAGRTYYGVGGPINLVVEDAQHSIAPLTMVGTQFLHTAARNANATFYVYSPFASATVKFFDNPASGGITAAPTTTTTVAAGNTTTFTSANVNVYFFISSDQPILVTTTQSGADKTILSPASKYVYQRYLAYDYTVIGTTATTRNNYCISDPTNSVMAITIADGSGGDCAQGLGLEFLSDRYSWGNVLSDYAIVFPYTATVTVSYWNGSAWVVWDTHTVTGNLTNPSRVFRDGTNGPGVEGNVLSGAATNMASGATLWKWEGTAPFYLCINDSADDEFSVLGWMNTRVTDRNKNQYWIDSISNNQLAVHGSLIYNSAGYWSFPDNQITNYLVESVYQVPTSQITWSCWFRSRFTGAQSQTPFTYSVNGDNHLLLFLSNSTTVSPYDINSPAPITVNDMTNQWCNFVWTRDTATGVSIYYMNGIQVSTRTYLAGTAPTAGGYLIIGQEADSAGADFDANQNLDGDFARLDVYNRALTAAEIRQNFNAMRGRFGI